MQDNLQVTMDEFLPLRDVVFNTLRQAILTGELKPGERLMEIHLANKLGVSRTPIREAIRKLELEGLVTMIPRRGAEVAQITEKSMNDVLEVRRAMDALCVELACDRITPELKLVIGYSLDIAHKPFCRAALLLYVCHYFICKCKIPVLIGICYHNKMFHSLFPVQLSMRGLDHTMNIH